MRRNIGTPLRINKRAAPEGSGFWDFATENSYVRSRQGATAPDRERNGVNEGANEQTLFKMASEKGLRPYYHDGAEKVLLGITSAEEVLQAS